MRTLLVGAGTIARQHLAFLATLGNSEVAICDLSPVTARAMAERYGTAEWGTDYRALLRDWQPDVVHVTTPPTSHLALATEALEAGAHAIVEKPLTMNAHETRELLALAEASAGLLVEDYNYVFNDPVRRTLAMIDEGAFGEVVHVEVEIFLNIREEGSPFIDRGAPSAVSLMQGGAIADFLPHLASVACAFIGQPTAVSTVWQKRDESTPLPADEFRALVHSERSTAHLVFSSHSQPDAFWVRVYGTEMSAVINLFDARYTKARLRAIPRPLIPLVNGVVEAGGVARAAVSGLFGKLSGGPGAYGGLWVLLALTYESIETGTAPPVTIEQIRRVNGLIEMLVGKDSSL